MVHLLSLRNYRFPQKDKNKHYKKVVKNQNRKLLQFSSYKYEGIDWLLYRPCHQTPYGVKHGKWRLVMQKYFFPKVSYQTISKEEYDKLESQVIETAWHNNYFFHNAIKSFLDAENEAMEYENQQNPEWYNEQLASEAPTPYD